MTATVTAAQKQEHDLSGMCSQDCIDVMMGDPSEVGGNSGKELQRSGLWVKRKTTAAEEAAAGMKFVWKAVSAG